MTPPADAFEAGIQVARALERAGVLPWIRLSRTAAQQHPTAA
jgi:hypothetical protein